MNHQNQETNFAEISSQLFTQLLSQHYSRSTLASYKSALNKISRYMQANNLNHYTKEIGSNFLQQWEQQNNPSSSRWQNYLRTITLRLNDVLDGKSYIRMHSSKDLTYPAVFGSQLDDYLSFMRRSNNRESTINVRRVYCTQLLCSFESQGLTSLSELQPNHIYDAFISLYEEDQSKNNQDQGCNIT